MKEASTSEETSWRRPSTTRVERLEDRPEDQDVTVDVTEVVETEDATVSMTEVVEAEPTAPVPPT